jgi:hypothetical protein
LSRHGPTVEPRHAGQRNPGRRFLPFAWRLPRSSGCER